jgi:hypothetical protein
VLRSTPDSAAAEAAWVDQAINIAVMSGVGVLVLVGFATSYHTLLDLAVTAGGYPTWLAPAVPLSFDLGIVVLSLKVAQAAREGRHAPVLRLLVASLSAATVVANASAVAGLGGRVLHAVPPAMFVVCFESVVITARRRALQVRGAWPAPIPRQHPLRWLLAPRRTWITWRAAVLGEAGACGDDAAAAGDDDASPPLAEVTPTAVDERSVLITRALQENRHLTSAALRTLLADSGHEASLRTVQRLRASTLDRLERGAV